MNALLIPVFLLDLILLDLVSTFGNTDTVTWDGAETAW